MQLDLFSNTALENFIPVLSNNPVTPTVAFPNFIPSVKIKDYRLTNMRCLGKNWKIRAEDNIRAVERVIQLEQEKREITVEDQ